jgi:hypothetical protein
VLYVQLAGQSWSWRVSERAFITRKRETKVESKEANDSDSLQEGKETRTGLETVIETVGEHQSKKEQRRRPTAS